MDELFSSVSGRFLWDVELFLVTFLDATYVDQFNILKNRLGNFRLFDNRWLQVRVMPTSINAFRRCKWRENGGGEN